MSRVTIRYFAVLREQRGLSEETIDSAASTPAELYESLRKSFALKLDSGRLRVAINDNFASMDEQLNEGDVIAFIAPVAGG